MLLFASILPSARLCERVAASRIKRSESDLINDWGYDTVAGRVLQVAITLGGIGYTESMTYDAVGRVSKITYPATLLENGWHPYPHNEIRW